MADQHHLDILMQGTAIWQQWRQKHRDILVDLSEANLSNANLSNANLSNANLSNANLSNADLRNVYLRGATLYNAYLHHANLLGAYLSWANLSHADLSEVNLFGAYLREVDLSHANLKRADARRANFFWPDIRAITNPTHSYASRYEELLASTTTPHGANLSGADLTQANLSAAILREANLSRSNLSGADLSKADLTGCFVYATSTWDITLTQTIQANLVITPPNEPSITVDNLEVAQFIYLLLHNERIRAVIDTITSTVVLILGRFTTERKDILDAIRAELRKRNFTPVIFDFEQPASQDLTETISTLAHLARFIIADITDPKSIPQELQAIVPTLAVPVQPVLLEGEKEYAVFGSFKKYPWVLPIHYYKDKADLLASLKEHVINPAEQKAEELTSASSKK
jgi:uncharacterized protein YjbI with pentapeptide repeats